MEPDELHQQSRGILKKLATVKHAGLDTPWHTQSDWFAISAAQAAFVTLVVVCCESAHTDW